MRRTRHDHPFVVEIGALRRSPGTRQKVEVVAAIPELFVSGSHVPEHADVRFSGILESVHDGILVTGVVEAPWEGDCRRCLEVARGSIRASLRELAVEDGDEETTYALDPEELDLEPIVHDACILELPLAPLCAEDCQGLCPDCGANRNTDTCTCAPAADARWGPLVLLGGRAETSGPSQSGRAPLRRPANRSDSGHPRRA
jgi:uncharacterized protein